MRRPSARQRAEQRQAVDAGQAEVEHHGVVGLAAGEVVGALAVAGHVDGIAGVAQGIRQVPGQARLVLDHQEPHRDLPL